MNRSIYTDGWKAYDGLILNGYDHYRIFHHDNEFARGKNHVNGIESFWSFAKRRMAKFNGLVNEHFILHLKDHHMKSIIDLLKFFPLTVFMLTARLNGLTDFAWKQAFILGGLCTIIILGIHLYKKVMLDRLMLGINLFLLVGTCAFLSDTSYVLYYFGAYKGAIFLSCIFISGLLTTFFSEEGFIGIKTHNKKMILKNSLQLLFLTVICIIWSLIANNYGLIISAVIPFIIIRTMYAKLGQIEDN